MQHLLIGELYLLLVPNSQWNALSIDFVVELLKSSGYDVIITAVNSVSK